jgi:hypothetical protein
MRKRQAKKNARLGVVTVYVCDYCYGGSEEGGWYWTRREKVTSMNARQFKRKQFKLDDNFPFINTGRDLDGKHYSDYGSCEFYETLREKVSGENELLKSGGYC